MFMEQSEFDTHLEVFYYIFNRDYKDVIVNQRGLKVGYLHWSSLTGDAQRILLANADKVTDPKLDEVVEKFLKADPFTGSRWLATNPVSMAESFTQPYLNVFDQLIENSITAQKKQISKYQSTWENYCQLFKVKEPNIRSLVLANLFTNNISEKDLEELVWLSRMDNKEFVDKLAGTSELALYTYSGQRYLPGRNINLGNHFPWLFPSGD
jgi:hypothetical protein